MADLEITETCHENGSIKYRYSRYFAPDGSRSIRHGLFVAYSDNGTVVSEGTSVHGVEHDPWKEYHPNSRIVASVNYDRGAEISTRIYWNADGQLEE